MFSIHFSDLKLYVSGSLDVLDRNKKCVIQIGNSLFFVRLILGNGICDRHRSNKYQYAKSTHIQHIVASCLSSIS